jgi:hypothetical protein
MWSIVSSELREARGKVTVIHIKGTGFRRPSTEIPSVSFKLCE